MLIIIVREIILSRRGALIYFVKALFKLTPQLLSVNHSIKHQKLMVD